MATFVLIHGGGDVGWHWHLLQRELTSRGHDSVAPDLSCGDDSATLVDYADSVVEAAGDRRNLVVVGHSYGAFTAPLVADRLRADALVLLAGMIPSPGETPAEWWAVFEKQRGAIIAPRLKGVASWRSDVSSSSGRAPPEQHSPTC